MKELNLVLVEESQQNPFYDPAKSNNGGGYDQPYYRYEDSNNKVKVEISDTSCGDFGSRIDIVFLVNDELILGYTKDSVGGYDENCRILTGNKELIEAILDQIPENYRDMIVGSAQYQEENCCHD